MSKFNFAAPTNNSALKPNAIFNGIAEHPNYPAPVAPSGAQGAAFWKANPNYYSPPALVQKSESIGSSLVPAKRPYTAIGLPVEVSGRSFRQPLFVGQRYETHSVFVANPPANDPHFNFDDLLGQLNGHDNIKDKLALNNPTNPAFPTRIKRGPWKSQ
jgi:hypothetical protein